MISLQQFARGFGCTQMTAAVWYAPITSAMAEYSIDSPRRVAAFMAQVGHESDAFARVEENLNYGAQRLMAVWPKRFPSIEKAHYYEHSPERLANSVYADRMGNGPYESGDGYRYRGRGPIQITGADNYRRCGKALSLPLSEQPELLLMPRHGARSAGWYWSEHDCNEAADAQDQETLCRAINGGLNGLAERTARYLSAIQAIQ